MKEIKEEKKIETIDYDTTYEAWDGTKFDNLKGCIDYELAKRFKKYELTNNITFYTAHSIEDLIDFIKEYSTSQQWYYEDIYLEAYCNANIDLTNTIFAYDINHSDINKINKLVNNLTFPFTFCVAAYDRDCDHPDELYLHSFKYELDKAQERLEVAEADLKEINQLFYSIESQ